MPYRFVNGVSLYYELVGEGPPLVLLSGTGIHGNIWKPYHLPFFSKDFKVLTLDYRGTGRSDKPDVGYSTRLFAEDVAQLMDALSLDKAHILGHSMGGRVAQWIALDYPDKARTLVLAASGCGNYRHDPDYPRWVGLNECQTLVEMGYLGALRHLYFGPFSFSPRFIKERPDKVEEIGSLMVNDPPPLRFYLRHVIARQQHETTDRLKELRLPVLVMVGSDDRIVVGSGDHVEQSRFLASAIPNAEFVIIPEARHLLLWERPEECNRIILDFLRRKAD